MPWIESHTVLLRHRKVINLAKKLRIKPVYAIGHLHALWHAALEQQEDGDLSRWNDELIAELSGFAGDAPRFVSLLIESGWLDTDRKLHDWLEYAGRYLESKYKTSNPSKLSEIQARYGKTAFSLPKVSPPNQPKNTLPNQPTDTEREVWFEEVWKTYPKKAGRKHALRHYLASVKTLEDREKCVKALANYKNSSTVKAKYVKNGSTFFNEWQDWITPDALMMNGSPRKSNGFSQTEKPDPGPRLSTEEAKKKAVELRAQLAKTEYGGQAYVQLKRKIEDLESAPIAISDILMSSVPIDHRCEE